MIRIIYNDTDGITDIAEFQQGQSGITFAPIGSKVLQTDAIEAAEILADQGIDILPIYEGGYISKLGHDPYVKHQISNHPINQDVTRYCIVRRIPIRFDLLNFKVICEVQHFRGAKYLGQENSDLDDSEIINDKWHVFTTTNELLVDDGQGGEIGEFDYYFTVLEQIPFRQLINSSIKQLDQLGRFNS